MIIKRITIRWSVAPWRGMACRLPKLRRCAKGTFPLLAFAAVFVRVSAGAAATPIYVDGDAPGGGDGASWATAFTHLQDALAVVTSGDEIRVAREPTRPTKMKAEM